VAQAGGVADALRRPHRIVRFFRRLASKPGSHKPGSRIGFQLRALA
jgi:hypothetical protein